MYEILLLYTECADGKRYYGHTEKLRERLREHQRGYNKATRHRRPVKLVYYEPFNTKSEALKREMQFKYGKTRKATIDKLIKEFSQTKCQGLT